MKSFSIVVPFFFLCVLALAQHGHAADMEAGKADYVLCAACHGPNGEGNIAMNGPKLAGQDPWYIKRQLAAFRDGLRGTASGDSFGMQMRPMAMAVADPAAEENLIAFISSLPSVNPAPTVTGDPVAGKAAYTVCAACHGQNGEGQEQMGGPRLAGQSDWYLVRQLNGYKNGLRGYDSRDTFGKQMQPMAATLSSDQAVSDVVAYINTLK